MKPQVSLKEKGWLAMWLTDKALAQQCARPEEIPEYQKNNQQWGGGREKGKERQKGGHNQPKGLNHYDGSL